MKAHGTSLTWEQKIRGAGHKQMPRDAAGGRGLKQCNQNPEPMRADVVRVTLNLTDHRIACINVWFLIKLALIQV